jgi:hypothetical protein
MLTAFCWFIVGLFLFVELVLPWFNHGPPRG